MTLAPERPVLTEAETHPLPRGRVRDRYIDSLRAAALVRVVTYHVFGWVWLPIVFPSMGIMFALAGSLVAASLDRSPGNPWRVLVKRGRRLLPPLWLMGAVLVPVMVWHGWHYTEASGAPLSWKTLLFWIVPISDPPGSAWAEDWVVPLWYIRAYLWFLLLSPAFLWLFRRWPKRILAVPLGILALATLGVITLSGRSGDVILSMSTFGACWLLGFAHHDGSLRRVPLRTVLPVGFALLAAGLGWAFTHQDPQSGWDIDNIPLADGLYGLGAVLLLLRCYPDFSWMARRPVLDKLVTVVNSRAMTIYLWNNVAIFLATPLADSWSVTAAWDTDSVHGRLQQFAFSWLLVGVAIFAFGWVEDLAARRPLRVNPWPGRAPAGAEQRLPAGPTRPRWMPEMTMPRVLTATGGLVVLAALGSAWALSGTHTPPRPYAGDAPPTYAVHPRVPVAPPKNLAQRSGQSSGPVKVLERLVGVDSAGASAPAPSHPKPDASAPGSSAPQAPATSAPGGPALQPHGQSLSPSAPAASPSPAPSASSPTTPTPSPTASSPSPVPSTQPTPSPSKPPQPTPTLPAPTQPVPSQPAPSQPPASVPASPSAPEASTSSLPLPGLPVP